ncbi:carboxypeptidase A2-like protein [Dinothrombium tinctorium]|uniref:Carboxypeptidase A2-like protein n=1 Tax=Dinothrombium tinctorium TaxID=1965070 RepID=A0A3S3S2J6_9ACAR|nr:carboxypeptidase A2-like protein [Dinothrombium tinctorium]
MNKAKIEILWNKYEGGEKLAIVKVDPKHVSRVKRNPNFRFITNNLQHWIELSATAPFLDEKPRFSGLVPEFRLDKYHPLSEVELFLYEISKRGNARVLDIGLSHEGRHIKAVEILNNPNDSRFVWIDGCTHAREWITVSTALFLIEQAIVSRSKVNFIIVPVINPDGYVYTWTVDRLWRKNRRLPPTSQYFTRDECYGIDLNRNYDINFGGEGSSRDPCSHIYQGSSPFSEPETSAVAKLIWAMRHKIKLFLSLHSFHQLWSCPYAFTKAKNPHFDAHMEVLNSVRDAIYKTSGEIYNVGPLSTELYIGSGFSLDWTYAKVGIVHSYLSELRDKGVYGFMLPSNQIMPTALETWAGLRVAICKIFKVDC